MTIGGSFQNEIGVWLLGAFYSKGRADYAAQGWRNLVGMVPAPQFAGWIAGH